MYTRRYRRQTGVRARTRVNTRVSSRSSFVRRLGALATHERVRSRAR